MWILSGFVLLELLLVSPFLYAGFLLRQMLLFGSSRWQALCRCKECHCRRILACVDAGSFSSVEWTARDFLRKSADHVIVLHVIEPAEPFQLDVESVRFSAKDIDSKDFYIPPYMSEFCHWLGQNGICYEGLVMKPLKGISVADTIVHVAKHLQVDSVVASASQRLGSSDVGHVAFQVALKSEQPVVIVK